MSGSVRAGGPLPALVVTFLALGSVAALYGAVLPAVAGAVALALAVSAASVGVRMRLGSPHHGSGPAGRRWRGGGMHAAVAARHACVAGDRR